MFLLKYTHDEKRPVVIQHCSVYPPFPWIIYRETLYTRTARKKETAIRMKEERKREDDRTTRATNGFIAVLEVITSISCKPRQQHLHLVNE